MRRCLLLLSTARSLVFPPQRDMHPTLSPRRQTSVFVFRGPLTNRHQRLQPLNLSFRCPHSLCNAVGGQHSPRKPRCGAGRLSTTPDTKIYINVTRSITHKITTIKHPQFNQTSNRTYARYLLTNSTSAHSFMCFIPGTQFNDVLVSTEIT